MKKRVFTIVESADARHFVNNCRRCAFTLAETLITLIVIGVVAVLTIPALMQNINERSLLKQRQTTAAKIAEGFAQMRVAGDLETKYSSTAEFVDAMKKHFQIVQICNSNNLTNCFFRTVITNENDKMTENNIEEMENVSDVVGIRFADGVSMLIKYNPEAQGISDGQSEIGRIDLSDENSLSYPTYGDLFEYIFDVNNEKSPNTKGKDILGGLSVSKAAQDFGLGFSIIAKQEGVNYASAAAYCSEQGGSLPNVNNITEIINKIYLAEGANCKKSNLNADEPISFNYTQCDKTVVEAQQLKEYLGTGAVYIWSDIVATDTARMRCLAASAAGEMMASCKKDTERVAICVK